MRAPFSRWSRGRFALFLLLLSFLSLGSKAALATHWTELNLFDQIGSEKKFDEGVARQHLGLLNPDGKPFTNPDGSLVDMISADGQRAAYAMNGGSDPSFDARLQELEEDGGTLIVSAHGNKGVVKIDQVLVKGFGRGTNAQADCAQDPVQLTAVRTNLTINFAVCHGADGGGGVTSVATSLTNAITALGGSVRTMNASAQPVDLECRMRVRVRDGYQPTQAETQAIVNAFQNYDPTGRPFSNQYKDFQNALNAAAPPDQNGIKVFAVLVYKETIPTSGGDVVIQGGQRDTLGDLQKILVDESCQGPCNPTPARSVTWGTVKSLYRD